VLLLVPWGSSRFVQERAAQGALSWRSTSQSTLREVRFYGKDEDRSPPCKPIQFRYLQAATLLYCRFSDRDWVNRS
jgi:hypothetical protein